MSKIANSNPTEERDSPTKRADEARRQEDEQERERLSRENKNLTRDVSRLKNEVSFLKDEAQRQEERLKSARSRSDRDREALIEEVKTRNIDIVPSPRGRSSSVVEIREVIKEVPVITEVIKEVIREIHVPGGVAGPTYESEGWWGEANAVLEDTIALNQKRIGLVDRVEVVADHLRKYRKAGGSTPKNRRAAGPVNLDRKSTRLNSSHRNTSRMPSSA